MMEKKSNERAFLIAESKYWTYFYFLWIGLNFVEKEKHLKFCLYLLLASPSVYLKIVLELGWGLEWNRWAPKIGGRKYVQFNNVSFSTAHKK